MSRFNQALSWVVDFGLYQFYIDRAIVGFFEGSVAEDIVIPSAKSNFTCPEHPVDKRIKDR